MKNKFEQTWMERKSGKSKITVIATRAAAVITIVSVIVCCKSVKDNQELKKEVERLSDSVAVYEEASKDVDIHVINAEIQNIGELTTVEYLYTDAGKFEDPAELFGQEIPFSITTKSFVAKWDGSIKAGVDIHKVYADVHKTAKEIIVHLPKAEILSHEIIDESIETLDEKNGLFNKLKVEDVREFDAVSKDNMEQRALENGLLDKALENAKNMIYNLIDHMEIIKELGYTITFQETEEL